MISIVASPQTKREPHRDAESILGKTGTTVSMIQWVIKSSLESPPEQLSTTHFDQYAKSLESIDLGSVDTVVTLCAEEVSPALPAGIGYLHWPIPGPAAVLNDAVEGID